MRRRVYCSYMSLGMPRSIVGCGVEDIADLQAWGEVVRLAIII